jgi:preprotein translocase SecE subunit
LRGVEMNEFLQKLKSSFHNGIEFIKDTRKELKNVSWPGRKETTGTTLVVIAAVFFFGFFLWMVDFVVYHGLRVLGLFQGTP